MAERPQAFLCPSPLKSVNNCTALFPPLCFVSSLVLGNIGGGGGVSCHSASHVSWDMQGLLFVLETQELY